MGEPDVDPVLVVLGEVLKFDFLPYSENSRARHRRLMAQREEHEQRGVMGRMYDAILAPRANGNASTALAQSRAGAANRPSLVVRVQRNARSRRWRVIYSRMSCWLLVQVLPPVGRRLSPPLDVDARRSYGTDSAPHQPPQPDQGAGSPSPSAAPAASPSPS